METFEQLTQTVADHETCLAAFKDAEKSARDISAAVAARIKADRAMHDERVATMTAQSMDPNRPAVVRKLAVQELDRLQNHTFGPTADEIAAFDTAMKDAQDALRDAVAVRVKLRDLFTTAAQELAALRSNTLGSGGLDTDLAQRHLDGEQRAFDRLAREDGGSGE